VQVSVHHDAAPLEELGDLVRLERDGPRVVEVHARFLEARPARGAAAHHPRGEDEVDGDDVDAIPLYEGDAADRVAHEQRLALLAGQGAELGRGGLGHAASLSGQDTLSEDGAVTP
jgi:hypothetical protein